ncbi:ExbD/TolR family protein [Pelagicoccus mobilis]|uniref:Biopolymer transporter ExbD n=1 Tax=Pelagicoccus mobilis TaxID=415221 RepID=A0A934RV77_9BACT|nr:biopolymer transporter ExbD [Pelagicoccus mobilis]MBK1875431.1 biopolymer transporter ExbD [Pelagicoccus mobilis]
MARRHRRSREETDINITPMLDVVFIMLIFFIVTTSFVKETGIEVNRPSAATAEKKERGNILIGIRETGEIYMNKQQIDIRAVRANVERSLAENPEGQVVIVADKGSKTGVFIEVMDQARLAGAVVSVAAEQQ